MDRKLYQEYLQAAMKDRDSVFDPLLEALADKYGLGHIKTKIDNCREVFQTLIARNETTLSKTKLIMDRMARGEYVSPEEASELLQELGQDYKGDAWELLRKMFGSDIANSDRDEYGN